MLGLRGALLAIFFAFALAFLDPRRCMSACVAAHVALHAERPVASVECALECCGTTLSADQVMAADGKLTTFARVAVNVDLEQRVEV